VESARTVERSGRTGILWRVEHADRGPDRSGVVRLDDEGRPVLVTSRTARSAQRTSISYPARIHIRRPSPLCSAL
jgi:hypothetical protein